MRIKISILILSFFLLISCKNKINQNPDENYDKILTEKEKSASENPKRVSGTKIDEISFEVKANTKDFDDGIQHWASIEKPEVDLLNLINKEKIVIFEKKITIIIDYPLTNEYKFDLSSDKGFTREMLLTEISKHYYKLYEEEENSAAIKTVPMDKRTMYNRNQTNGKYGIWGHDISDLVLSYIEVYKNDREEIILVLGVDS